MLIVIQISAEWKRGVDLILPQKTYLKTSINGSCTLHVKSFDLFRSSHTEVFLGKGVLEIWSKFTGEHPRCDFNKVAKQLYSNHTYWNHTSAWVFSCKFAAYFQITFSEEHLWVAASAYSKTLKLIGSDNILIFWILPSHWRCSCPGVL